MTSSSVSDLEDEPAAVARSAGPDDRPKSARDPPLAPDHLADVLLRDMEAEHNGVVGLLLLDPDGVGVVDELPGEVREQLSQGS